MEHQILLLLVLISTVGIGAQWLAWRLGIPTIVVLLAAGFALGPATGILNPSDDFGAFIGAGISVAVSVIVLEGGLGLNRSEEHTSELQSLMRISYAVFCLKKKKHTVHSLLNNNL